MKNSIYVNDIICLLEDVDNIPKGTIGTVVYEYNNGESFEVEFNIDNNIVKTLNNSIIEKIKKN